MVTLDPWPGESLEYYDAADGADFSLYGDLYYRDSGGRTIASGDVWRVWYEADWVNSTRYLDDPGADVVVSWVLEVTGGAGTIVASEGLDPDYGDEDATAPTALGTFTVTGPGTLVIPSSLMGASQIVDGDDGAFMVRLECTSGSIDVQQAKIRVWPPGGPVGTWVVRPSFDGAAGPATALSVAFNITATAHEASTPEPAWDAAVADFYSQLAAITSVEPRTMDTYAPGSDFVLQTRSCELVDITPETHGAGITGNYRTFLWFGADPTGDNPISPDLVEGVDWVRPPGEVHDDRAAIAQQLGDASTGWIDAHVTFEALSDDGPGGPSVVSVAGDFAPDTPPYEFSLGFETGSDSGVPSTVPLDTNGRVIRVSLGHSAAQGDADAFFTGDQADNIGYTFGTEGTILTFAAMPAYRVWLHTAVAAQPLRLLQRGDGLGMGSGRVLGAGTRQGSIRVFGSL